MIRILVYGVSNSFGGIETFFINLLKNNDSSKLQFDFITSSEEKCMYEQEILDAGGVNHPIITWGTNSVQHKKELNKVIETNDYDYIWINTTSASKYSIYKMIKESTNAKIIIHSHGSSFDTKRTGIKKFLLALLHHLYKNKINKIADLKFAASKQAASWLFNENQTTEKVYVIKNGIDVSKFTFSQESREIVKDKLKLDGQFVIGHVGRFNKVKNHSFLLQIFNEVKKQHSHSTLMLIGTGELDNEIKNEVAKIGLTDAVLFLGYQENTESYLSAMDAFVLPSIHEGLSIAAAEAQASDLYCFLSDTVPEEVKITNDVEYLSLEDSPRYWADEILKINKNRVRINRQQEFNHKKFDINSTVREIEKILTRYL